MPIVGQFYKGSRASALLSNARRKNLPVFLQGEPFNRYDSNAFKVQVWCEREGGLVDVGYVQRHAAAKLRVIVKALNSKMDDEDDAFFDDHDDLIVGTLSAIKPDEDGMQFLELTAIGVASNEDADEFAERQQQFDKK